MDRLSVANGDANSAAESGPTNKMSKFGQKKTIQEAFAVSSANSSFHGKKKEDSSSEDYITKSN